MSRQGFSQWGEVPPQGPRGPKAHRHHGRHGGGPCGPGFYEDHGDRAAGFAGGRGGRAYEGRPDRHGGWGGPGFGGPGGPFGPGEEFGRGGRGGRGGPGGRRGRGPRASRGDIRAAILVLLSEDSKHGYQVMREISERSGGVWRPSPGSIYPTLQQLQDEGLVASEEGRGGRRMFSLTDEGKDAAKAREGERAPWDAVGEEFTDSQVGLRDLVFQIGAAARQVVVAGTPEQATRAEALLKETRRGLYRILAEDETEPTPVDDDESPAS